MLLEPCLKCLEPLLFCPFRLLSCACLFIYRRLTLKLQVLFKKTIGWVLCLSIACWLGASPTQGEEEPPTITRPINIDEATVTSAYYVTGSIDNAFAQGHSINLQGEGLFQLGRDWGLDVTFPQVFLQEPQGPAALGPLGGGPRWVFERFHSPDGEAGGIFSLEAQGFYWATPDDRFPGVASSYSLQALGAFRLGRTYLQGNYGYNGAFDANFTPNWFAFSALGYALSPHWDIQVEGDFTDSLPPNNGGTSSQWVLVPQVGFKTDGWLFEVGLAFTVDQPGTATDFVLEHNFF